MFYFLKTQNINLKLQKEGVLAGKSATMLSLPFLIFLYSTQCHFFGQLYIELRSFHNLVACQGVTC